MSFAAGIWSLVGKVLRSDLVPIETLGSGLDERFVIFRGPGGAPRSACGRGR